MSSQLGYLMMMMMIKALIDRGGGAHMVA